jgi:hypothetical protein
MTIYDESNRSIVRDYVSMRVLHEESDRLHAQITRIPSTRYVVCNI